jgi:hypothetical protein
VSSAFPTGKQPGEKSITIWNPPAVVSCSWLINFGKAIILGVLYESHRVVYAAIGFEPTYLNEQKTCL